MTESSRTLTERQARTFLLVGFALSQISGVTARLGIADAFDREARSAEELARATGTDAPSVYRLLRAGITLGLTTAEGDGRFRLTPLVRPGPLQLRRRAAAPGCNAADLQPADAGGRRDRGRAKLTLNDVIDLPGLPHHGIPKVTAGPGAQKQGMKQTVA